MSVQIFSRHQQAQGAFNGGEIVENKPIGFPQDGGPLPSYSSLFYWAHARAIKDSTIGLHPHQGFEICSFVLKGRIRHYDTLLQSWRSLEAGDVQIIRAGMGISHAEWMGAGAEMFQIWFDPNLSETLGHPASYDDYQASVFPVFQDKGAKIRQFIGGDSPFKMQTPDTQAMMLTLHGQSYQLPHNPEMIASVYLFEGGATLDGQTLEPGDFAKVSGTNGNTLQSDNPAQLFLLYTPLKTTYPTYFQRRG
jgi:redox-sensitive bicupin YhaK (pirin superfamily)